ncbi:putative ABC transport system permease protein [Paenibacillus sophorae]|uniref:ABC transporter permease n=1 Tax=Paenibacillus sophorae TaxID=1333845 RepID=A0A1H8FPE0_9BACL|nr:ABC transporter permease [Paenibacillus sophorae]QWU13922.1 ABC transporter permease [Paenibacillus sophorae]SEN32968.1 putative ABC transport system permease protein [Paenibacillus sophorae]
MFPNNTKTAVNKLAAGSMKMSRTRNRFVILAIILTTWLITSFFSIGMSVSKSWDMQKTKIDGTIAQAVLPAPTEDQLEKMKGLGYVKAVGLQAVLGAAEGISDDPDEAAHLVWYDETEWNTMRGPAIDGWKGTYPAAGNEIAAPLDVLSKMGIDKPEIGMSLPLSYTTMTGGKAVQHKETFKLTGWFKDYSQLSSGDLGSLLVSEPFMKQSGTMMQETRVASILFTDKKNIGKLMNNMRQDLKLPKDQVLSAASGMEYMDNGRISTLIGYGGLVLFVMLSGYLLIYNVLYLSVAGDTRFYGLLKTIGVTRRQIRTMIRRQALRLALIGIPIGLVAGAATSFGIVPLALNTIDLQVGGSISFNPLIFAGAALFALITTMVSCIKPARVAGKISPVEATKYTGITPSSKARMSSGGSKLHRMALRNIFRVKKRALVVFLSLFLGLTTFLVINTLVLSMNPEHFVDENMRNDFELTHESGWDKQAVTPELLAKIKSIPGVKDIRTAYLANTALDYDPKVFGKYVDQLTAQYMGSRPSDTDLEKNPDMFRGNVIGLDPADFREANKKLPSPVNVERFERGQVALLDGEIPAFKTGDRFTMKINGAAKATELEIGGMATFDGLVTFHGMAPNVYISQTAMKQIIADPIIYKVSFDADRKDWPEVAKQVKAAIAGNGDLKLESKIDMMDMIQSAKLAFYILGGGLALILALIGLLNFVNIMVTGVMVRKPELAVLESVGMTSRQIKKLLLLEGAWYAFISLLLVAALGNALAYGAYRLFSQEATYAVYTFPAVPLAAVIVLVTAVCLAAPVAAFRRVRRAPLAERLREAA